VTESDRQLDELLGQYGKACPEVAPSPQFMPKLWARIDSRRSFPFVFQRLARVLVTASAAACLLVGALNMLPSVTSSGDQNGFASYTDALSAEGTVERTYYSEMKSPVDRVPPELRH